jgi:hypothetical protein
VTQYALSLKQPWAALLVAGRKTIEVRRWPTGWRGPLLIHAARIPDERREAWALVSPELRALARLGGGFIGSGTLTGCKPYRDREAFAADEPGHLNAPAWFEEAGLFGFTFADLRVEAFRRYPGWVRIFKVEDQDPRRRPRGWGRRPPTR